MEEAMTSPTVNPTQIVQQAAQNYLAISNAPGCCVAVYDKQAFGTKGYVYPRGLSGPSASSPPVTTDMVFEIGSVTKVFTSTLLAVVVQAGGAWLTDTVGYYLNVGHNFSPNPVGSTVLDAIELVQFATHTSGMPEQPDGLKDYSEPLFTDQLPTQAIIDWWNNYQTPPSGCWQYSNIGFVTLGFALTQMFPENQGHNYNQMLAEYVTGPLGLTRTGAIVDPSWPVAQGSIGHWRKNPNPPPEFVFEGNVATGNTAFDLKSTGDDMLRFLAAQLAAPEGPLGRQIAMTQETQGTYPVCGKPTQSVTMGLAWQITKDKQGRSVYAKNGATSRGGFEAIVMFVPELSCGVAILSNQYFNASGPHPDGIAPAATARDIIAALHPGFDLAETLMADKGRE